MSRAGLLLTVVLGLSRLAAAAETPADAFRQANESAAHGRWDVAIERYNSLSEKGVRAPSLYWNWAQAAAAGGRKGEALWALLRGQELTPGDSSVTRHIERLRGELGLDPSEISLGFLGDARLIARRFRFDALALGAFLLSSAVLLGRKPRTGIALGSFLAGAVLIAPGLAGVLREAMVVVVQRDAPLLDAPKNDAVALANLREGEVVPLLGEAGEYVRIQDASGARGFAHKGDVRRVGMD